MKYFKTPSNEVYAFEDDGSQDNLVTSDMVQITEQELNQINTSKAQQNFDSLSYSGKRASAYPSIQEQLDMLWHSVNNGTDLKASDWFNQLKSVKDTYEKPAA